MRISRKTLGITLLVCFALTALLMVGVYGSGINQASAEDITGVDNYFGQQLTAVGKQFYAAMEDMAKVDATGTSMFMRGEDYDLVKNNRVTQTQLQRYAEGDMELLNAMGAARDAFYTDYDDIFYVDFGALSLRVTQSGSKFNAYLGAGRRATYWLEEFNSQEEIEAAVSQYEVALKDVMTAVGAATPTQSQIKTLGDELAAEVAKIREAHRQVAINTVYRKETPYEWETSKDDYSAHVRTPYGAFVMGKALCEGYARAFKAIMDELGIPCVLVNGVYRHGNNQEELHMWTHVKLLDGKWYAVDPTFDDLNFDDREKWPADKHPSIANHTTPLDESLIPDQFTEEVKEENSIYDDEMDVYYNEAYFLKGSAVMNNQHATSPYKSEAEYIFTYPELAQENFGQVVNIAHGGLFKVVQAPHDGAMNSTDIYVSVLIDGEWCGYNQAAEKGYYILVRYEGDYLPEKLQNNQDLSHVDDKDADIINTNLVWAYLNPIMKDGESMYGSIQDGDGYTVMQDTGKPKGLEFALTTRAPRIFDGSETDLDRIAEMTTFTGDLTMFEARSGFIPIKYGDPDYQPAPHIVRSTPTNTCKLMLSSFREVDTYDITIEYDQVLKFIGDATELKMSVYAVRATGEILKGTHAIKLSEVVKMDSVTCDLGEDLPDGTYRCGSISFRFTPYRDWAYDNVEYIFNFNLEGVRSHKQVNPATYCAGYECEALCYKAFGYHWNLFGQPRLMEEEDLSKSDWVTSDGTDVSKTKDRLALVVTRTTQKQEDAMSDLIDSEFDEDILKSFTYNISLTICKAIILETGQGVRVCVGFPEGFTYEQSMNGVAFKAYHFTRDAWDNITGVEEIECTVTPLGLVLLCKSFSPFAIVAATGDPEDTGKVADKTVVITADSGGSAYAEVAVTDEETNATTTVKSKTFSLAEGQTATLKVVANSGLVIETVSIGSKIISTNASEIALPIAFADLESTTVIKSSFVAAKVQRAEEARGESLVVQVEHDDDGKPKSQVTQVKTATVVVSNTSISLSPGEELKIEATVTGAEATSTRQWYKDGVAIEGATTDTLVIASVVAGDSGAYSLKVTTQTESTTLVAESEKVTVKVATPESPDEPGAKPKLTTVQAICIIVGIVVVVAAVVTVPIVVTILKKKKSKKIQ